MRRGKKRRKKKILCSAEMCACGGICVLVAAFVVKVVLKLLLRSDKRYKIFDSGVDR